MKALITGCYRVGSEYITNIIGNAPGVDTEMYLTNYFRNCYNKYDPLDEEAKYSSLVFESACRIRVRWDRVLAPHKVLDECEREGEITYGGIYDRMMRDLISGEVPHWAEKMQLEWRSIPDFLSMFDDAKAVLVIRDPRSILASFKEFTYAPEPRYLGAIFNALDSMQKGQEYSRRLSEKEFHIVKYEDVVCRPESTVEELLDFLGLSTDHNLLSEEGWTDTLGNPWRTNSAFDNSEHFDKSAAVHRWRGNLEDWELALCERVNKNVMSTYRYDQSNTSVPESEYIDIIESDDQIYCFFEHWKDTGDGVERYPADPTEPDNWAENN